MSGQIGSNTTNALTTGVQNAIKKPPNAAVGLFTVGALGAAAWMMRDSYMGSRDRINQQVAELKEENDVEYSKFGWGHWSGMPWFDQLAHKWFGIKSFGPYGIRENLQEIGLRVSSFWSDVIVPNLIPLGIGIAGLYGALGPRRMHAPIRGFVNWCKKTSIPPTLKREIGGFFKNIFSGMGKGLAKLAKWPFQSLPRLGVATGALFFGTFFLKKLNDAYGHDGQRAFFRREIYDKHGMD